MTPKPEPPNVYLRELYALDTPGTDAGLPMERAISKLRDEVTAVHMARYRGHDRALAMVITKLDEARLWAIMHGETRGTMAVIDRAEILRMANADTTDTTVADG